MNPHEVVRVIFCATCAIILGFVFIATGVTSVAFLVVEYFGFMLFITRENKNAKQP